ncbi:hypothetical protein [Hymenobacter volaticus]|uniref:Uncharacterized protein n=1 Tax=Hymenobacter volaticus TaxID=2932254 RepID=A0ABY4G200_9BACT|nr:hypothetical protein [Hymenobacter volaticus]UOQ64816.1 hypothetical protein MUN86_14725 [Hymenobacter volaticus]
MKSLAVKNTNNKQASPLTATKKKEVQPKLIVNAPGDFYEQEADRMAAEVINGVAHAGSDTKITSLIGPSVQRKCAACEQEERRRKKGGDIMRKADSGNGFVAPASVSAQLTSGSSNGSALPHVVRV